MCVIHKKIKSIKTCCIIVLLISVIASGCSQIIEEREFKSLSEEYIDTYFKFHPVEATLVGYNRFDHLVDDYSDTSVHSYLQELEKIGARLANIDTSLLSAERLIDHDIVARHLKSEIWKIKYEQLWTVDATFYNDLLTNAVLGIKFSGNLTDDQKCHLIIERLSVFDRVLRDADKNLIEPYIADIEAILEQINGFSFLLTTELNHYIHNCPASQDTLFFLSKMLTDSLNHYRKRLEGKKSRFNAKILITDSSWYANSIQQKYNLRLSIDELLTITETEYTEYAERLNDVTAKLYKKMFPQRKIDAIPMADRLDTILRQMGNDYIADNKLVDEVDTIISDLKRFISMKNIMNLPGTDSLIVSRSYGYELMDDITRLRTPGALDQNNIFRYDIKSLPDDLTWFEQVSFLREFTKTMLELHSIEKIMPGTMLATIYWNEQKPVLRKIFKDSYIESGWPVLAAEIMIEQGYGGYDPQLQLLHYLKCLQNATALIVDIKYRTGQIDLATAKATLVKRGFMNSIETNQFMNDIILNSDQFVYRVYGAYRLKNIYNRARKIAGNYFDSSTFWTSFFDTGTIPVDSFEESILNSMMKQYKN
ncbi:DUF885 family protein [candidate division KSB1 bacterium]|nr:DUF885 family protein [candidate division KSB1 bacterium]